MSDRPQPEKPKRRIATAVGLALVAGIALGAAGVYVGRTASGNATAANCPANETLREALDASARGEVAAVRTLDRPFDATAIAFKDADGREKRLADFAGRSLLVNVWATWCVPCRAEMPALDRLEKERGGADFAVVPISVDLGSDEKPKRFYADANLAALPLLRDETMGVFNGLRERGVAIGLPVSLLVDGAGCARAAIAGPAEWASPDGFAMIDALRGKGS
jgi:thiol-disulfide isomerase/thioredoxin